MPVRFSRIVLRLRVFLSLGVLVLAFLLTAIWIVVLGLTVLKATALLQRAALVGRATPPVSGISRPSQQHATVLRGLAHGLRGAGVFAPNASAGAPH